MLKNHRPSLFILGESESGLFRICREEGRILGLSTTEIPKEPESERRHTLSILVECSDALRNRTGFKTFNL